MSRSNKKKKNKKRDDKCPRCKGAGQVVFKDENGREKKERCDLCWGSGKKRG